MKPPVNRMRPVHPGEILREDYLAPLGMSAHALAVALSVPATRIQEIVNERRGISADTAERLARYFGGDAVSWLNLQATYDLRTLTTRDEILRRVEPRAT
jgi:addiction module HigA family antidote